MHFQPAISTASPRSSKRRGSNKENLPERLGFISRSGQPGSDGSGSEGRASPAQTAGSGANHKSPVSECRTLESPAVGSLSSPGSTLEMRPPEVSESADQIRPWQPDATNTGAGQKNNMELQLVNEIKERSEGRLKASDKVPESPSGGNPAAQLVTELFESIKAKGVDSSGKKSMTTPLHEKETSNRHEVDFKANLRKVTKNTATPAPNTKDENVNSNGGNIDFKSNLKKTSNSSNFNSEELNNGRDHEGQKAGKEEASKVESGGIVDFKAKLKKPKTMVQGLSEPSPEQSAPGDPSSSSNNTSKVDSNEQPPVDFKARLRKVSGNKPVVTVGVANNAPSSNAAPTPSNATAVEEQPNLDEKRKSTGSISSLRKMWESSDQSPALGGRKGASASTPPSSQPTSPSNEAGPSSSTVKFEKRVWPPVPSTETEGKPMVPVKPTMKKTAPPTTKPPPPKEPSGVVKPPPLVAKPKNVACNIYAAPTAVTSRPKTSPKPSLPAKPSPGATNAPPSTKDTLLGSSQSLEGKLSDAVASAQLSTVALMQLSENVGTFHTDCTDYVESVPATGRFRFRSLLSKLESQGQELRRPAGSTAENKRMVGEIQGTLKDLVACIQR